MKVVLLFALTLFTFSCLSPGENSFHTKYDGQVVILQYDIPDTVTVNTDASIMVRAEENSDCWSNLKFILTERNEFNYILEAYGTFESYGYCKPATVFADTVISFKPDKQGVYMFEIYENPEKTVIDSMIVVGDI